MRFRFLTILVMLAAAAPCFAENQGYFFAWCAKQLDGSTKVYTYIGTQTGSKPDPGPGGDISFPVQTPLTGKSCIYLKDVGISPKKAYPISNPVVKKLLGGNAGRAPGAQPRAGAVSTSQQDTFGWLVPLPFNPAVTIPSTATSGACDGSTSVYMVEHDTGQVEDLSVCPLKSVATITPCTEP